LDRYEINEGEYDGSVTAHIPAFEISDADAKTLRNYVYEGHRVYLKATMGLSNVDNSVEVDYWYSTSLDLGLKLANEMTALSYSFSSDHN